MEDNRGAGTAGALHNDEFATPTSAAPSMPPAATRPYYAERVLDVRHWNDGLFSFRTTRDPGFRFDSGQFTLVGLAFGERVLTRAYSIASAHWEETLEFFSIKVPDGALTAQLARIRPGDTVMIGRKPTGTLLISDLEPGRTLYLLATGTGLAPFLAIAKDPATYERFERVVVAHGVREASDLAYREWLETGIHGHEDLGPMVRGRLLYFPTVTREPFVNEGRLTQWLDGDGMTARLGLAPLDPAQDRVMICGSPRMLDDVRARLDARGFVRSQRIGDVAGYVYERAFVER